MLGKKLVKFNFAKLIFVNGGNCVAGVSALFFLILKLTVSSKLQICTAENDVEKPIFQDQIDPESQSIEEILMGMSSQIGEREDNVLCSDVRNMLFGPMEFSRRDLAALNIMRGRDNGLPDYNEVRKCHGLPKITKWEQINPKSYQEEPDIFEKMAEVYQNLVRYT